MSNLGAEYDFTMEQGKTFSDTFTYYSSDGLTPLDLTGYTGRMQIRETYNLPILASLTSANGKLAISFAGTGLTVTYTVTAGVITSAITIVAGGTGYVTGQYVFVNAYNKDAILSVTASAGVVTAATIIKGGTGYSNGTGVATQSAGKVTISLTATETAAFTFDTALYDIELVNGTTIYPFIYGEITLRREVTL